MFSSSELSFLGRGRREHKTPFLISDPCSLIPVPFTKQRLQLREERVGDDLRTFGGGMDAVLLDGAGDVDEILVDHGHKRNVMPGGEVTEDLLERVDVVGAVVGREGDAGQQDFDVRGFKGGQDLVKIAAGLVGRQAAQAVVAAEFDDDDFGVQQQDGAEVGDRVLGGGAAGALVVHLVVITVCIEFALQRIRVRLAGLQSIAGGDAVAEADENGPVCRPRW